MKRSVVIGFVVVALLVVTLFIGFKTGNVVSPIEVDENNNKAGFVIVGEVIDVEVSVVEKCTEERVANFNVKKVVKGEGLITGDIIEISYTHEPIPVPYDCISGNKYANLNKGDYLKLYLDKKNDIYQLRQRADSVKCEGCLANNGRCPKIGSRFGVEESMELFKIPSTGPQKNSITNAGGSYCDSIGKMAYYSGFEDKCVEDYECKSGECNGKCLFEASPRVVDETSIEVVVDDEPEIVEVEAIDEKAEIASLSFWERFLGFFRR